jgi:hypothetical protein
MGWLQVIGSRERERKVANLRRGTTHQWLCSIDYYSKDGIRGSIKE